jgi:F-type H+-transporting ATPase subunit epsilon
MFRQISPTLTRANRGNSYNRYLAIAARTVRRSLKETPRLNAERRGQMDLRFAKWQVS